MTMSILHKNGSKQPIFIPMQIQKALENKSFASISCQDNSPEVTLKDLKAITEQIKSRIKIV